MSGINGSGPVCPPRERMRYDGGGRGAAAEEEEEGPAGDGGEASSNSVGEMGRSRSISSFFWIRPRVPPPPPASLPVLRPIIVVAVIVGVVILGVEAAT